MKFGSLTVVKEIGKDNHRNTLWFCLCDCGQTNIVSSNSLLTGKIKSCGCRKINALIERNTRNHTAKRSINKKLYQRWAAIKQRCCNPNCKRYKDYGGRGITLSEEWMEYEPFYDWAITHGYEEGLDIDRIDNDKGYSENNCHFVTRSENNRNKRKPVRGNKQSFGGME